MEAISGIKSGFLSLEKNASLFGSESAKSAGIASRGLEDTGNESRKVINSMGVLSDSSGKVQGSVKDVRREFNKFGSEATDEVEKTKDELISAQQAAKDFGSEAAKGAGAASSGMNKATDSADGAADALAGVKEAGADVKKSYKQIGAEAGSFKEAVFKSSTSAIKDTNSLSKTIKAGVQGAYGFAGKQADQFGRKVKVGASEMKKAFSHPIQTIKNKMSEALDRAVSKLDKTGDQAEKVGNNLKDMGRDGESAGSKIKDSIGSAVKSFFAISAAIEIIKAGIEVAKNFGAAILEAGKQSEQTGAKFSAMFAADSGVKEWSDNFSAAIHRSNTEVQGFLVSNKSMYEQLGITGGAAEDLSKITTSLAYDFGSAFKMEDADALGVIQDYINGNTSALNEYGIKINDTTLKQTAMSMGLGSNIDSLNDAAMAQVRMNALLQNSTEIQEAAAKKQEGYSNGIKSLKGVWTNFLTSAGERFAPVFTNLTNSILTAWPQIEPALLGLVDMLGNGLGAGMPVIMNLATSAFPALIQTVGELFASAAPLGSAFMELATTALPPLVSAVMPIIQTFGSLAQTILPPLAKIITNIATTVAPPLVTVFRTLSEGVIAPLMPSIESIANAILPALSAGLKLIPPILQIISPIISTIADVLSKVVGFLGKIVEWAAGGLGAILDKVGSVFVGGSSKAGANIPHNADGTNNFQGGWTHINERGGEMAFLPSGSTIIPADKSEQIINNSRSQNVSSTVQFNPEVKIEISGNVAPETVSSITEESKQALRELWREFQEDHYMNMAIQQGNA
ncbi:MAG: hypothetical protein ACK5H4_12135 [Lacrimispora sphenoides]